MHIEEEQQDRITILSVSGDIETHAAPLLKARLQRLVGDGNIRLLFDLEHVTYICSAGVAVLITWSERIRTRGGSVAVCGLQGSVGDTFRILRLDRSTAAFQVFRSRAEALEDLKDP